MSRIDDQDSRSPVEGRHWLDELRDSKEVPDEVKRSRERIERGGEEVFPSMDDWEDENPQSPPDKPK